MLSLGLVAVTLVGGVKLVKWGATAALGLIPVGLFVKNRTVKKWNKNGINPESMHLNPFEGFISVTFTKEEVREGFEVMIGSWILTEPEFYQLHMFMEMPVPDPIMFEVFLKQIKLFSKNRSEDPVIRNGLKLNQKAA